jgi:hypothetical protein
LQLSAGALGPRLCSELLEDRERRREHLAGVCPSAPAAQSFSEAELGAGALERARYPIVPRERGEELLFELVVASE